MTKRTPYGYTHPNAYRKWEPEQDELLRIIAVKGRDTTALSRTMGAEALAFCLGRSPASILKRAAELEVAIYTNEQLEIEKAMQEKLARQFVGRVL
jgi:hypothetical protein